MSFDMQHKIRIPDLFEAIFDLGYLIFAIGSGIQILISARGTAAGLFGGLTILILGIGDSFHLLPRVKKAISGITPDLQKALGCGLFVSSVSMTIYYILLFYYWRAEFPEIASDAPPILGILLWVSALIRIVICMFPQNRWLSPEGNQAFSLMRNIPFALTGLVLIIAFLLSDNTDGFRMWRMSIAILLSFACYFPVTLFAKRKPAVGMLMIPKTCAYIWMIFLIRAVVLS